MGDGGGLVTQAVGSLAHDCESEEGPTHGAPVPGVWVRVLVCVLSGKNSKNEQNLEGSLGKRAKGTL
jgi:hypothetical protein